MGEFSMEKKRCDQSLWRERRCPGTYQIMSDATYQKLGSSMTEYCAGPRGDDTKPGCLRPVKRKLSRYWCDSPSHGWVNRSWLVKRDWTEYAKYGQTALVAVASKKLSAVQRTKLLQIVAVLPVELGLLGDKDPATALAALRRMIASLSKLAAEIQTNSRRRR